MSLTRKYYKMIAQVIKDNSVEVVDETTQDGLSKMYINKHSLINDLSKEFKRDNINFNYTTFEDACK